VVGYNGSTCNHPSSWKEEPLVSVTVLNWNGINFLRECLDSLMPDICPHVEVVLADNGSTDGSLAMARTLYPEVRIVDNQSNLGVAGGRNATVPHLRGRFIVFLDNDVVVVRGWLPPLIEHLINNPKVGVSTAKLLLSRLPGRIQSVGNYYKLWTGNREIGFGEPEDLYPDGSIIEPFYASGATLAVQKELFEYLGGFDERMFPTGADDIDFCWRARLAGYKVVCLPEAGVYHHMSLTRGIYSPNSVKLHVHHLLRTMVKCQSRANLLHSIPAYIGFTLALGVGFSILNRDLRVLFAILTAIVLFTRDVGELRQSRSVTQKLRKVADRVVFKSEKFGLLEPPWELWHRSRVMKKMAGESPLRGPHSE